MGAALNRLGLLFLMVVLLAGSAEGHLFHQVFEVPDTQLTKDYTVLLRLIDFPNEHFALAEQVYRGEQRVRLKPGGFRSWLRRPSEPGMVFKADYQLRRWSGSLEGEAQRLDQTYGTTLRQRIEAGLQSRNAEAVKAAFREFFFYLIGELFEAIWMRLDEAEAPGRLYDYVSRYFSVSQEAFLNINYRAHYVMLRAVLDALERTLGDGDRSIPPAPEAFHQQRARFLRMLGQVLQVSW
ncbi:MAG TPA: hypothetical protein VNP04_27530 [Alphaproteobacteria bacterium]|nr:hypothetical protein [Alphaproteobacteria bacterium]